MDVTPDRGDRGGIGEDGFDQLHGAPPLGRLGFAQARW
jgi:hypothetical protein